MAPRHSRPSAWRTGAEVALITAIAAAVAAVGSYLAGGGATAFADIVGR